MVLRLHGKNVRLEEIRDLTVSGRDATNAQTLIEAGRLFGLRGRAVNVDFAQLRYLPRGAILHWGFTHFVVYDRLRRGHVRVVDPRRGDWRVPVDHFRRVFTGVAVIFEPTTDFAPGTRPSRRSLRYLRQILTERGFLAHIVITSLLLQVFGLGLPLLNRILIDRVIPRHDYGLLLVLMAGLSFLVLFQSTTSLVRAHLLLYLRTRLDSRMTLGFLDHLLGLPFDFFQRRSTADLLIRMSSNATVRDILTTTVLATLLDGTLAIGYLAMLLVISPTIAALAGGLALLQVAVVLVTMRRQRHLLAESIETQARSQNYLMEILTGVEAIKSLGADQRVLEHWAGLFAADLNVSLRRGRLQAVTDAVRSAVGSASSMALLILGTTQVLAGVLTLGDMMAVVALASGFLGPIVGVVGSGSRLQLLTIYLERLDDVLQTPGEVKDDAHRLAAPLSGEIEVRDVSFRYSPITPFVVKDVTTRIGPGEFVAIVGRTGAGKSTLARLLVGLYVPTAGHVRYDGKDLRLLDVRAVRRQIGVVSQHPQLLGGTIQSNIALVDPEIPIEAVMAAAKVAHLHEEIMAMPMGYDTPLIDRGGSLSGGQQQRLALARALVRSPKILVLDEATSQLDALTERAIHDELARLECTRIVIAHRLSTVRRADRILVLDNGLVVEEGTHDGLIGDRGRYYELVAAQLPPDRGI